MVRRARIRRYAKQPRRVFNEKRLARLANSLRRAGQSQIIQVRPVTGDPDHDFELIAGERRWRAAEIAEITWLKAEVKFITEERAQFRESFLENCAREDLSDPEVARGIKRLMDECGMSAAEIAEESSHTVGWVHTKLSLLNLHPDILDMLELDPERRRRRRGGLTFSVAMRIARLTDQAQQLRIANAIEQERMPWRKAFRVIYGALHQAGAKQPSRHPVYDFRNLRRFLRNTGEGTRTFLDDASYLPNAFRNRTDAEIGEALRLADAAVTALRQVQLVLREQVRKTKAS